MAKDDIIMNIHKLIEAKENVVFCLDHPNGMVGMCGISYWAGEVERLRKELREVL